MTLGVTGFYGKASICLTLAEALAYNFFYTASPA